MLDDMDDKTVRMADEAVKEGVYIAVTMPIAD